MSEQFTTIKLQEIIDYLREYVKRGDPTNPVADIIGRAFTYLFLMKSKLTGEEENTITAHARLDEAESDLATLKAENERLRESLIRPKEVVPHTLRFVEDVINQSLEDED